MAAASPSSNESAKNFSGRRALWRPLGRLFALRRARRFLFGFRYARRGLGAARESLRSIASGRRRAAGCGRLYPTEADSGPMTPAQTYWTRTGNRGAALGARGWSSPDGGGSHVLAGAACHARCMSGPRSPRQTLVARGIPSRSAGWTACSSTRLHAVLAWPGASLSD